MGGEISSLVIQPLILGIAIVLLVFAELKYDQETLNKALTGIAIGIIAIAVLLGWVLAFLI
jgi:hypothetical protein